MLNRAIWSWIWVLALVSGCTNLAAIRDFAASSSALAGYSELRTDYIDEPNVQKRYQPKTQHARLDEQARKRAKQGPALDGLHGAIEAYMGTLGHLAADELSSYDNSLDTFGAALLEKPFGLSQEKVDAFSSLAKLLARAVTERYRERNLRQIIVEADAPLQQVLNGLSAIVGKDFVEALDEESTAIDKYYRGVIAEAERTGNQHAALALLRDVHEQKLDAVRDKRRACQSYAAALTQVGEGHRFLKAQPKLSGPEALARVLAYAEDIRKSYQQIKALQ